MKQRRSRLGGYIRRQRKLKGLRRSDLAKLLDCQPQDIFRLEYLGDDDHDLFNQLTELLDLDSNIVERCLQADKKYRQVWIRFCGMAMTPMILPAGKPGSSSVDVPRHLVTAANETIEEFAHSFAEDWDRTIELFVCNHIRIVISPTGEMEFHEMGIYGNWMTESAIN